MTNGGCCPTGCTQKRWRTRGESRNRWGPQKGNNGEAGWGKQNTGRAKMISKRSSYTGVQRIQPVTPSNSRTFAVVVGWGSGGGCGGREGAGV